MNAHVTSRVRHEHSLLSSSGVDAVQPEVRVSNYQLTVTIHTNAMRTTTQGLVVSAAACTCQHTHAHTHRLH